MKERNQQSSSYQNTPGANSAANRGHGSQGIDKAPGEETAQDNVQFEQQTQKGKKVDADPARESDRPLDHQDV